MRTASLRIYYTVFALVTTQLAIIIIVIILFGRHGLFRRLADFFFNDNSYGMVVLPLNFTVPSAIQQYDRDDTYEIRHNKVPVYNNNPPPRPSPRPRAYTVGRFY